MQTTNGSLHGAHLKKTLVRSLGRHEVESDVRDGHLIHFSKGVLVERKRVADLVTRAAAALLYAGPDAVLNSHTAVRLYGCQAADEAAVHVLLPYKHGLRSKPGVAVHHSAWEPKQIELIHGMPVLALEHSLAELLCRARTTTAFACLEQALAMQPEGARPQFRALVADSVLARADRRGYRRAATLLDLATGLTESPAESWMMVILVDSGLPNRCRSTSLWAWTGVCAIDSTSHGPICVSRWSTTVTRRMRAASVSTWSASTTWFGADGSLSEPRQPT